MNDVKLLFCKVCSTNYGCNDKKRNFYPMHFQYSQLFSTVKKNRCQICLVIFLTYSSIFLVLSFLFLTFPMFLTISLSIYFPCFFVCFFVWSFFSFCHCFLLGLCVRLFISLFVCLFFAFLPFVQSFFLDWMINPTPISFFFFLHFFFFPYLFVFLCSYSFFLSLFLTVNLQGGKFLHFMSCFFLISFLTCEFGFMLLWEIV
jgi:hypothetical protein